ncbi:MAG: aminotransferase class V-fold PLP-dependent enzyme [Planctomycetaceae bacterium]
MADPLLAHRPLFPILQGSCYLISNSLGAMPSTVARRMQDYAAIWAERGVRAWAEEWWAMPVKVGDEVAPLLGAPPGSVSMHTNVTLATAVFFSCLTPGKGRDRVVTTALQFPSILYLLERWCTERGARLEIVPCPDGIGADPARLLEAIDERTLAVSVSHVEFKSAYINDAEAIARRCRATGALLLLDVFQSAGVVPIEARRWGVDAAVGGCLKWLCGGPGNVFLYIDPDLAPRLAPRLTGWMAHQAPFSFEPPPIRPRGDAYRFLNGTPQIACLYAASPGLAIHRVLGIDAIRRKSMRMTAAIVEGARGRGWRVNAPDDPARRGGSVALDVPHGEAVAKELNARNVVVDFRPGAGIRIAPHFYNRDEECAQALEEIDAIQASKAYERHRSVAGTTPT